MRKCLFAGLITFLPLIVTYIVVAFCIGIITAPFEYVTAFVLKKTELLDNGLGFLSSEKAISIVSKVLILTMIVFFIYFVGFIAARVMLHSWVSRLDELLKKIPIFSTFYRPLKELVHSFFNPPLETVRQSVLIRFPSSDQITVGIATGEFTAALLDNQQSHIEYVSVFIPSTPNATNGYLCSFEKSSVRQLDMPADEALKYVMSLGSTNTPQVIAIKE